MSIRVGTQPIDVLVNGTITNVGPGTVYYKDDSTVTVADNDGFILAGSSADLDGSQWLLASTSATYVQVATSIVTNGTRLVYGSSWPNRPSTTSPLDWVGPVSAGTPPQMRDGDFLYQVAD